MTHGHPDKQGVRPFLRWAGAKRAYVSTLAQHVPDEYRTYYEPFLGSASLFFYLLPTQARLTDTAGELVSTFNGVKATPNEVHSLLTQWNVDKETYYYVRGLTNLEEPHRTARFIYLNKTCWNGLYRVNRAGQFNVPFGRPKSSNIVSLEDLLACSKYLQDGVEVQQMDFEESVERCNPGDFVFFDPPYVTDTGSTRFKDYNEKLFSWDDQRRLAACAAKLVKNGVAVLVTNADDASVRSLYPNASFERLERHSTLAGASGHRRKVTELIIRMDRDNS